MVLKLHVHPTKTECNHGYNASVVRLILVRCYFYDWGEGITSGVVNDMFLPFLCVDL